MSAQQHYHGEYGWSELCKFLDKIEAKKILLVTGNQMYRSSGAKDSLEIVLGHRQALHLTCIQSNPRAEDADALLGQIDNKTSYQAIIAVGGGSVIDTAKLLKAFWRAKQTILEGVDQTQTADLCPGSLPLIAVPTTAGSGSEATRFAVVYKNKKKYSVEHDALLPDLAVVIPSLLKSVPAKIAAASGVDALCQGIESLWSIHSTEESRQFARDAITLAWQWIEEAVNERSPQALDHMAKASHLAGCAINITKTTAPHAVSYPMTSYYGITHGHAVGLLTSRFLEFNAGVSEGDCLDPRGPAWVKERLDEIAGMLNANTGQSAAQALTKKLNDIGLETDLGELGIDGAQNVEAIIGSGLDPARLNNNPRDVDAGSVRDMLAVAS